MMYTSERNYGCRFTEVTLFGYRSIILENDRIRTMILLDKGTEVVEFNLKKTDTDFLWRSPLGLSTLRKHAFCSSEAQDLTDTYTGGWFEAFPSIGHRCVYRNTEIRAYGEVCYLPWELEVVRDDPEEVELRCFVRTTRTPFFAEKWFTVRRGQASLCVREKITHLGREPVHYQWGHHPIFGGQFLDEHCVIELPSGMIMDYKGNRNLCLTEGAPVMWPRITPGPGTCADFSRMPARDAGTNDLLFLSGVRPGWAAIRNQQTGQGVKLSWDPDTFDHCMLWMVANGDTGYPGYGQHYFVSVIPSSTGVHQLSSALHQTGAKYMERNQEITTWLTLTAIESAGEETDGTQTIAITEN